MIQTASNTCFWYAFYLVWHFFENLLKQSRSWARKAPHMTQTQIKLTVRGDQLRPSWTSLKANTLQGPVCGKSLPPIIQVFSNTTASGTNTVFSLVSGVWTPCGIFLTNIDTWCHHTGSLLGDTQDIKFVLWEVSFCRNKWIWSEEYCRAAVG